MSMPDRNKPEITSTVKTAEGMQLTLRLENGALYGSFSNAEGGLLSNERLAEIQAALHARDGRIIALGRKPDGTLVHRWFLPESLYPWKWETLDGKTNLPMKLLERHTGGVEAFLIDEDGVLQHRWTNREFKWADAWASLESEPCLQLQVENNREGFPQAYILKDGHKGIAVRRHLNDGTWNAWHDLGNPEAVSFTTAVDGDGWVVLTALDGNGKLSECRQTGIDAYSDWKEL